MSSASQILERDSELGRIAEALDSAAAGNGRVLVIEGQAGIGKTRLVHECRALAHAQGFARLQAVGDETETAMAWGVVRQMVERSVSRYRGEVRDAILAGPAGAALRALDQAPDVPAEASGSDADVARTLHALWWVAIDLSVDRPLLITVDDAQWADAPSVRFLGYLARRIADLPIALVVATRPPTGGTGPLTELTVSPHVERMLPEVLSRAAVASFHTPNGTPPCPEVAAAMHTACGGNPFLTGALLDELVSAGHDVSLAGTAGAIAGLGPATISRAMLSRLSPQALRLAGAAAVLGLEASPWLAGQIAPVEEAELTDAVDELVRSNVLVGGAAGLTFVHPVIREATAAALGGLATAGMHARAALALHERGISGDQLAVHLLAAPLGTLPGAADVLATAAAHSLAAGDLPVATAYLERALQERPGDAPLRRSLADALLSAGRAAEARPHLEAALDGCDDPATRAGLVAALSQATLAEQGPAAAVTELAAALASWPDPEPDPHRLLLEARLAVHRQFVPAQRLVAAEHLRRFVRLAGDTADERTLLALLAQDARYSSRPHAEAADYARRALGRGALFDDAARGGGLVPWVLAMMSFISADALGEAQAELDRARLRVARGGSPIDFSMVANTAMLIAWRRGDVTATETEAESAVAAILHEPAHPETVSLRATAAHFLCYVALERRELPAAQQVLADLDAYAGPLRVTPMLWLHEVRSRVHLAAGDPVAALQEIDRLRGQITELRVDPAALAWRLPAAIALSRLGQEDAARERLAEQVALAERWGSPADLGAALRVAARFETDPAAREQKVAEALALLARADDRLEHAKALVDQAETWRALGRRSESRELLAEAGELAATCGSPAVRRRVADALEALGDRPRRDIAPGPGSLTASERRVATLAVIGRSNRDIAQELFVSPKTVENHLGRVYTKLGIANRRELASALG